MDGNTEDLQKFVPQVHFEQIPIKNLCSNQDYQRNLSIKHVQRAAANFDLSIRVGCCADVLELQRWDVFIHCLCELHGDHVDRVRCWHVDEYVRESECPAPWYRHFSCDQERLDDVVCHFDFI